MNVLIVEDEELAAGELINILSQIDSSVNVLKVAGTIEAAVGWLAVNHPDLIFMDINLGDGESFEIFKQTEVKCPVIFTTAYDQYTLKAFKNQGIDYILKPFDSEDISLSLKKVRTLTHPATGNTFSFEDPSLRAAKERNRFMINLGSRIKTVGAEEIAYFMADGKHLFLFTREGEEYIIEETITSVEPQLSSKDFFRINRKFIIHIQSIKEMFKLTRNRIKILLEPHPPGDISVIVSEDRAELFKSWLNL